MGCCTAVLLCHCPRYWLPPSTESSSADSGMSVTECNRHEQFSILPATSYMVS